MMPIRPLLMRNPSAAGNGLLDAYTANMWSAASLKRLVNAYPNSALVENTGSGSDANIAFDGSGNIDQTALLAHTGAAGTVQSFLDQTGNSRPWLNATSNQQPQIVSGSAYLGHLEFDGSNDNISTGAVLFGGGSAATIFLKGRLRSTASLQIIMEHTVNYNTNDAFAIYYDNSISRLVVSTHRTADSTYGKSEFNVSVTTSSVWCFRLDRTQTVGANQNVLFVNGTKQTRTGSTGETATLPSGGFTTAAISLGCRAGTSLFSNLDLESLVVYSAALSDADCTAISALLA